MANLISDLNKGVLLLTIDRPPANAFDLTLIGELQKAFKQAAKDSQTRVVILTGAGRVFGAGQDIGDLSSVGDSDVSIREHLQRTYNPLILQMRQLEKPIIGAINGPCAGASLGVALACDFRIAGDTAKFVVGFTGIGLVPDSAVSLLLPVLIGLGRASELTFSNAPISAEQALDWGLVNKVVPLESLAQTAAFTASELSKGPIGAFGLTKRAFNKAVLPNLEEVLDYEGHLQEIAGNSVEHIEGVKAFLEKRAPKFS